MSDDRLRRELHREANRVLIDAEYTGRQHFYYSRRWRQYAVLMGLPSTIIAAATSSGAALSALLGSEAWVTALLAFCGAVASAVRVFFQPDEKAARHHAKGAELIEVSCEARRFMNIDLHSSRSVDTLSDQVQRLGKRIDQLRHQEPTGLPEWTYRKVKDDIDAGNYSYENDGLWSDYR